MKLTRSDLALMHEAMWDNAIDARKADALGVEFEAIEARNNRIFEQWLERNGF